MQNACQLSQNQIIVYNDYMREFTAHPGSSKVATYGNVQGELNKKISDILIKNIQKGSRDQFLLEIQGVKMPPKIAEKAQTLANRYLSPILPKEEIVEKKFQLGDSNYDSYSEADQLALHALENCCDYPKLALAIEKANPTKWYEGIQSDESITHFIARKMNRVTQTKNLIGAAAISMKDLGISSNDLK
jgi:hypothetical protein